MKIKFFPYICSVIFKKNMGKFITIMMVLLWQGISTATAADRIFFVSRNLNKNIIVYDVNLKNGKLDTDKPLHPYWYRLEENPITTGELTFIQRKLAYGYSVEEEGNNEEIKARMDRNNILRKSKQPVNFPSAGSIFKRGEQGEW